MSEDRPTKRQKTGGGGGAQAEEEEEEAPAIWELEPKESHSDFSIEVMETESKATRRYHVHKVFLTVGGHASSDYFNGLLREGGQYEEKTEITIPLDDDAAQEFPAFLNYLYTGKLNKDLSAQEAVLLLHLADYFRVPTLIESMKDYASRHVSLDNLSDCLSSIIKYRSVRSLKTFYNQAILLIVEAALSNHGSLPQLLKPMHKAAFKKVLGHCTKLIAGRKLVENTEDSAVASSSRAVAEFLAVHKEVLSKSDFDELTSTGFLPAIAPEVALQLLEMESKFLRENEHTGEITSLQERCISSLGTHGFNNVEEAERVLRELLSSDYPKLLALAISRPGVSEAYSGPVSIEVVTSYTNFSGPYKRATVQYNGRGRLGYKMSGLSGRTPNDFYVMKYNYEWRLMRHDPASDKWYIKYINSQDTPNPPVYGWFKAGKPMYTMFVLFHKDEQNANG